MVLASCAGPAQKTALPASLEVGEEAYRIVVTTDIHYLAPSLHDQGTCLPALCLG